MSREAEFELGEGIILLVLLLVIGNEIKKGIDKVKSAVTQIPDSFGATEGTIVGPAKWVGNGQPLTAQEALSLSRVLGQELNYTLSPDSYQIWFFNGAYFDNRDGLIREPDGTVVGPAINSDGTENPDAVAALVAATN